MSGCNNNPEATTLEQVYAVEALARTTADGLQNTAIPIYGCNNSRSLTTKGK
jgi:hypothetical protein